MSADVCCIVQVWAVIFWHLWTGRAKKPGPASQGAAVEVFNVGGWLTDGDFALEAEVDYLAVVEHRLIPAGVRSEWSLLKTRGLASIWSPLLTLGMLVQGGQYEGCSCCFTFLCHSSVPAFL